MFADISSKNTSGYKSSLELYKNISMLTWLSNTFMLEICLLSMSFCCVDTRNTTNISSKYISQIGGTAIFSLSKFALYFLPFLGSKAAFIICFDDTKETFSFGIDVLCIVYCACVFGYF